MTRIDVVGLGVSTLDVLSLVEDFPGEEGVTRAEDMSCQGGGPVATALASLARLGKSVAMIDRIGSDWRGQLILDSYAHAGVVVDAVQLAPDAESPLATILVRRRDGARAIIYHPGSGEALRPEDLPLELLESARFLHVNGRHWEACLAACRYARQRGVRVSFDGGAHRFRPELLELLPLVDVCIVAREFAQQATGTEDVARALLELRALGPSVVVITDGAEGSWVLVQQDVLHQPAFLSPGLVDTTGCGDAYHGAFLFALLEDYELAAAARFASAVAALNTCQLGGRSALPNLAAVQCFLKASAF